MWLRSRRRAGDREVLDGALRLRAVEGVGRDADLAHRVVLDADPDGVRVRSCVPSSHRPAASGAPRSTRSTAPSASRQVHGPVGERVLERRRSRTGPRATASASDARVALEHLHGVPHVLVAEDRGVDRVSSAPRPPPRQVDDARDDPVDDRRGRSPSGSSPVVSAVVAAATAPQQSWPRTTTSDAPSTSTPYSIEPITVVSSTCPAVRTTNTSPRPWSKMISAATRESEQPKTTANGCCATLSSARWSTPCDGCCISPRTNRSFPSRSADQASAGVVGRGHGAMVAGPDVAARPADGRIASPVAGTRRTGSSQDPGGDDVSRSGRCSVRRRTRALALVLGAAVAAPLAACAGSGSGTAGAHLVHQPGRRRAGRDRRSSAPRPPSGAYAIETSVLPRDASAQREQLARRLAAKDSSIDIMSLDPPFIPEIAEPGLPGPGARRRRGAGHARTSSQGALDGATWKDELVTVPFWANTQLLWYRKSVAEAAGLDLTPAGDLGPDHRRRAEDQDKLPRRPGHQGRVADRLDQRARRVRRRARSSRTPRPRPTSSTLGLDDDAGGRGRRDDHRHDRRATASVVPGLPTADEDAVADRLPGRPAARSWSTGRSSGPRTQAARRGRHARPVAARRHRLGAVPAGRPRTSRAAPPYGGINLGVGAFSEHVDLAYEAAECIVSPENQAEYFVDERQPAVQHRRPTTTPRSGGVPDGATSSGSRSSSPSPRPQTPYYNEVSTGLQQTWHPPSAVDPGDHADGVDRPDHRRPARGAAAVSTTTLARQEDRTCATPQRRPAAATARSAEAPPRLAARRPGVRRHARRHRCTRSCRRSTTRCSTSGSPPRTTGASPG